MPSVLQSDNGSERVESIGILGSPTPGTTVAIDLTVDAKVYKWTASQDETVNISGTQLAGQEITCQILDSGTRTITFGTGFKAAATVVGVNGKTATVTFRSDGTNFYEVGRAVEIT